MFHFDPADDPQPPESDGVRQPQGGHPARRLRLALIVCLHAGMCASEAAGSGCTSFQAGRSWGRVSFNALTEAPPTNGWNSFEKLLTLEPRHYRVRVE